MIDLTSKKFKTLVEATTSGILTEIEASRLLDISCLEYRQAVADYFLILAGKKENKNHRKRAMNHDTDILEFDTIEILSKEVLECQKRRKVANCENCLWFNQNCPHLEKGKEN